MSSTRQAVILLDILVDFGNLPDFTPDHQVLLETGINGGIGGFAFGSPMIDFRRRNPVSGSFDNNILLSIFILQLLWRLGCEYRLQLLFLGGHVFW
jgi:hypothetical protein